jgi:hypothetical protein
MEKSEQQDKYEIETHGGLKMIKSGKARFDRAFSVIIPRLPLTFVMSTTTVMPTTILLVRLVAAPPIP